MKPKVLISFTTSAGHPYVHKTIIHTAANIQADERIDKTIITPSKNPTESNYNQIVKYFVDGKFDFWINIDSDNPPIRNPIDLIFLDKDIIGCATPVWHVTHDKKKGERPVYLNGYDYVPEKDSYKEHQPVDGLQKVDAVGAGCIIINKRVFAVDAMRKGAFLRQWDEEGIAIKGNDISFCEMAIKNGFSVWCHYDYKCMHFNVLELNEVFQSFDNMYSVNNEDT